MHVCVQEAGCTHLGHSVFSRHQLRTAHLAGKHPHLTAGPPPPSDGGASRRGPIYCCPSPGRCDPAAQGPTESSTGATGPNNAWPLRPSRLPVRQTAIKGEHKVGTAMGQLGAHVPDSRAFRLSLPVSEAYLSHH